MSLDKMLDDMPEDGGDPDDLIVREAISGNLCRCTGYGRILEAVSIAADLRRGNRT
jgi:carbon-monoxide dehydrogenase small subunit